MLIRSEQSRRILPSALHAARIEGTRRKLPKSDRVAVIASFAKDNSVSTSLSTLIREFEKSQYTVVLVRAGEDHRPLDWPDDYSGNPIVIRRPNVGYDFGSWAVGLALFNEIRRKQFVILANDSLVGPFSDLAPLLENFETSTTDVWGATNTLQMHSHIQSFFVGYRGGVLNDPALRQFWTSLVVETDKAAIIHRYEMGLSRLLYAEGFTTSACFESERIVATDENPTMRGWRTLLELGFPFVKREILVNPAVVPDGGSVPQVVRSRFGVNPRDWL
ncbi:rhamnan synthesis F family protein [Cryobacterium sp. N19]|uniref:rhamnan synthesis F family protein n=1 Tax=Cryobacterium sp. N19 TaxID=2048288 RepID=UPI001E3FCF28|nr:rhamnan synthesis F family protein [Cryobacterium sp. N19]